MCRATTAGGGCGLLGQVGDYGPGQLRSTRVPGCCCTSLLYSATSERFVPKAAAGEPTQVDRPVLPARVCAQLPWHPPGSTPCCHPVGRPVPDTQAVQPGWMRGLTAPAFSPASLIVFRAAAVDRPMRLGTATGAARRTLRGRRSGCRGRRLRGRVVAGCAGKGVQCHGRAVEVADVVDAGGVAEAGREGQPPSSSVGPRGSRGPTRLTRRNFGLAGEPHPGLDQMARSRTAR